MHHNPNHADDLNDLERRLASWTADTSGLDGDALLFAAGRASVRVRFLWPTLACAASMLSVALGIGLWSERTERIALAGQLQRSTAHPVFASPSSALMAPVESSPAEELPPSSYLAAQRALERGLDAWTEPTAAHVENLEPPPPHTPILRVGRPDVLPDL